MQLYGMQDVLDIITKNGIKLNNLTAVELFGRDGTWHTHENSNMVKTLEIWEIDPSYEKELQKNFPTAKIKIVDSILKLQQGEIDTKYNFVVIDNPQTPFGPKNSDDTPIYCEHFQILKEIKKIIIDGYVIFNVNTKPYNYEKFLEWKKIREEFYGIKTTDNLDLKWLLNFYLKLFEKECFVILDKFFVKRITPRPYESLYYFVYKLLAK